MRADEEQGQIVLVLVSLLTAAALGGAVVLQVAVAGGTRSSVQAAADGAALAAAQALRDHVEGTDAARWECADAVRGPLESAARAVAEANHAALLALRRDGCAVTVTLAARPGSPAGDVAAIRASATAAVQPGTRPGGGPLALRRVPGAPLAEGTLLQAMVAEADRIDGLGLPYVWGGGHQSSPAPANGPFDCSGAVSRLLQSIGYPIPTLVSRDLMRIGAPGPGRVTVWAYDGHVFLTIDGRGWGTGSRPSGGAGWLPYATPYHGRFVARHLPELEDDTVHDLRGLDLGSVWGGTGPGTPPEVRLVRLGG